MYKIQYQINDILKEFMAVKSIFKFSLSCSLIILTGTFKTKVNLYCKNVVHVVMQLEKGFQKKTTVAFTNSTVFILDFNI